MPLSSALASAACAPVGFYVMVALEIPRRSRLEAGGEQEPVIRELVRSNWLRTLPITASALPTLSMVVAALSSA